MAGMISYRNECDENGIDMSISVNRIAFNAAKINYRDICSNRTVTFANNKAVVKKICLYLGPGLVEIEKDANGDTFITRKQGSPERRLNFETGKSMVSIVDEAIRMRGAINTHSCVSHTERKR